MVVRVVGDKWFLLFFWGIYGVFYCVDIVVVDMNIDRDVICQCIVDVMNIVIVSGDFFYLVCFQKCGGVQCVWYVIGIQLVVLVFFCVVQYFNGFLYLVVMDWCCLFWFLDEVDN